MPCPSLDDLRLARSELSVERRLRCRATDSGPAVAAHPDDEVALCVEGPLRFENPLIERLRVERCLSHQMSRRGVHLQPLQDPTLELVLAHLGPAVLVDVTRTDRPMCCFVR